MSKAPSFQWYPKDCDTDETVRLMDDEHFGFYVRCLNHAWLNHGLPESIEDIAKVLGRRPSTVRRLWKIVGRCFEIFEKRRINFKQEQQRDSAKSFSESRRSAAVTRWKQKESQKTTDARASENECIKDARAMHVQCSPSPSPSPIPPISPKAKQLSEILTSGWDDFIERYPNQIRVDQASQDWISLADKGEITDANIPEVLAGLQRWIDSAQWAKDDGQYIPSPSTFLVGNEKHKGRMWKDNPPPSEEVKASRQVRYSSEGRDPYAIWQRPKDWPPKESEADAKGAKN